jgi:hypothetical protein
MFSRNRDLLQWREPKSFWHFAKAHASRTDWLRVYLLAALKTFGKMFLLMIALWVIMRLIRKDNLPLISAIPLWLALIVTAFVIFASWLVPLAPSYITFKDKTIVRTAADGAASVAYKDMQACTLKDIDLDGKRTHILEVELNNGKVAQFEVPSQHVKNVKEILQQQGVVVF